MPDFDNIAPQSTALLIPRHSFIRLNFSHASPALLGEWYEVALAIKNEEDYSISSVSLQFSINEDEGYEGSK